MRWTEFSSKVQFLINESALLKKELFKMKLFSRELNYYRVRSFMNVSNDFIRLFDDYSNDVLDSVKSIDISENINCSVIEYEAIKPYVYNRYDYASILPFTDGLIKGISSGKIEDVSDVNNFFEHTVEKAFKDLGESSAEIIDDAIDITQNNNVPMSKLEISKFNTVRKYNQMFDSRTRTELYKAIDKTIETLVDTVTDKSKFEIKDPRMIVSFINSIVGYAVYSMTAFAARVFVISQYFNSYRISSSHVVCGVVSESFNYKDFSSPSDVTVFKNMDDQLFKDPNRTNEFFKEFDKFMVEIGCGNLDTGTCEYTYCNTKGFKNKFSSQLKDNILHDIVVDCNFKFSNLEYDRSVESKINELESILKDSAYNRYQGISSEASALQQILTVIKSTQCNDSLKEYQELVTELYKFSKNILNGIVGIARSVEWWKDIEHNIKRYPVSVDNQGSTCLRILSYLYRDINTAIVYKVRDIEARINKLKSDRLDSIHKELSIKIPGEKDDMSYDDNIMMGIPDTLRTPMELIDIYSAPAFESMELYDEYLRSLPEFKDDIYLSEAVNISEIINKIKASIAALINRITHFFANKDLIKGVQWITDHEQELLSLTFDGISIEVNPYKSVISIPRGFENLINNLKSFNENHIKSNDSVNEYIKSLYPSEMIYKWFDSAANEKDENKKNSGAVKYRNLILYYTSEQNADTKGTPNKITLNGNDIQKWLKNWVDTVKQYKAVSQSYKSKSDEVSNAFKIMNTKIVNITNTMNRNKPQANVGQNNKADMPDINSSDTNNNGSTPAPSTPTPQQNQQSTQQQAKANESDTTIMMLNMALSGSQMAIQRLWGGMTFAMIDYMKDEYRYIKEAYTIGTKKS